MGYTERRQQVMDRMAEHSVLILHAGIAHHVCADTYLKFEANHNFFYLTGLRRSNLILVMDKAAETPKVTLFIDRPDDLVERWGGKQLKEDEAKAVSGIENVAYTDTFQSFLDRMMDREDVETVYFDTYRHQQKDLETYNLREARLFAANYPGVAIKNAYPMIAELRMQKDELEIATMKEAIHITDLGLQHVLKNLKPGDMEFHAQANFEYSIFFHGADGVAFSTIAGSGKNATMLHYGTNREECKDGDLLLLDLGAKYQGYCADITRTYPVNGKFTERQRQVYDIVLAANRKVAAEAKPGMTTVELNNICKDVLAEGCIKLGLIDKKEDIGKYYMHGVSHHLGIDTHDVTVDSNRKLRQGAVITDEPGLYIDEWEIGIRIEDDLLITEDGCEILSADVMREADEIEAFMAGFAHE